MEKALRKYLPRDGFVGVTEQRSKAMAAVRGKGNKTTEKVLRFALVRAAISGWTMHPSDVPGKPDFYFPNARLAVFVDGCFWHGCPICGHLPRTNSAFWRAKLERNQNRDAHTNERLKGQRFRVLRLWEHELRDDPGSCVKRLRKASIVRGKK